jgi:thiol-disulfide isomerase/thioredoxin
MATHELNDANAAELFAQYPKAVVKFYADWCGMCRLMTPKFKKLSNEERFEGIGFLDLNAEENAELRATANANNLPFFAWYENGQFVGGVATSKIQSVEKLIVEKAGLGE